MFLLGYFSAFPPIKRFSVNHLIAALGEYPLPLKYISRDPRCDNVRFQDRLVTFYLSLTTTTVDRLTPGSFGPGRLLATLLCLLPLSLHPLMFYVSLLVVSLSLVILSDSPKCCIK